MARTMARPRGKQGPGGGRLLVIGGGAILILGLTFALGILVGRHWPSHREAEQTAAEPARRPAPATRRSGLTDPAPERPPQEKLTFYQTLTAPMSDTPASAAKAIVPPKTEPPKPEAAKPHPPADRASADRPTAATPASAQKPDKPGGAGTPVPGQPRTGDWAVQVGAFKDREQAESVRRPLAGSGFDAYLIAVPAADGQTQYKVRMGSYKTREDAARMAERVRQERSLAAFVTPK